MRKRVWIVGERDRLMNYTRAIALAGGEACFDGSPGECEALLLPGGGDLEPWRYGQKNTASRNLDPARDEIEHRLLGIFTGLRKPVLGICRGMQSINVFFGGTLFQDLPGHSAFAGTDRFHAVHSAPGSFFARLALEKVNSAHHQAVNRPGIGLTVQQWAEDGVIEAFCHRTLPVWGVQWHPERMPDQGGAQLFRAFVMLLDR